MAMTKYAKVWKHDHWVDVPGGYRGTGRPVIGYDGGIYLWDSLKDKYIHLNNPPEDGYVKKMVREAIRVRSNMEIKES